MTLLWLQTVGCISLTLVFSAKSYSVQIILYMKSTVTFKFAHEIGKHFVLFLISFQNIKMASHSFQGLPINFCFLFENELLIYFLFLESCVCVCSNGSVVKALAALVEDLGSIDSQHPHGGL